MYQPFTCHNNADRSMGMTEMTRHDSENTKARPPNRLKKLNSTDSVIEIITSLDHYFCCAIKMDGWMEG